MTTFTKQEVDESREEFMKVFVRTNGGKKVMKYIKEIPKEELPANSIDFYKSKQHGNEQLIEYHMFVITHCPKKGIEVIGQWRLTPTPGKSSLKMTMME